MLSDRTQRVIRESPLTHDFELFEVRVHARQNCDAGVSASRATSVGYGKRLQPRTVRREREDEFVTGVRND